MRSFVFGATSLGMAIPAFEWGQSGPRVLILGGVHGNEPEGVIAAYGLMKRFSDAFDYNLRLVLIPAFNVEGVIQQTRHNARGVDLNRNLPTRDWNPKAFDPKYPPGPSACSEPENQALVKYLEAQKPKLVVSLHSWKPLLNVNGDCLAVAGVIRKLTGYEIKEEIGYPTPGCLGTYAGLERGWPTLTYEIERGLGAEQILSVHVPALLEALKEAQKS